MYTEGQLRRIADGLPVDGWEEAGANAAAQHAIKHAESHIELGAFWQAANYENYTAAYVYRRADVERVTSAADEVRTNHPAALVWISHLAPVLALGKSSWSQTYGADGRLRVSGYGGLDLDRLMTIEDFPRGALRDALTAGIGATRCRLLPPAYLRKLAPPWFDPRERSEGVTPWDRLFHLFFQTDG